MDLRREKKRAIMRYAGYVAGTLGVGGLSALLSRGGMETFAHPISKSRPSLRRAGCFRRRGRFFTS